MIVAISGAGGFIGKQLTVYFEGKNYEVRRIARIDANTRLTQVATQIAGADVVINLAGAPIVGRWSKSYKKLLFDSRIITTKKIAEAINTLETKPEVLISASAVGMYSQQGKHTEKDYTPAHDYLAEICAAWETEARAVLPGTRLIIARMGIVLGNNGGALARMIPLFKLGLGGKIGTGKQGFSWIHSNDVVKAVQFLIGNKQLSGAFNFTAPAVVDNAAFTKTLAGVLKRPAFFTVPEFALKILFGEGSIAVAGGQFAYPDNLLNTGFEYEFPELETALKDITSIRAM